MNNQDNKKPLLIVSFTSYPARIHAVPQVLKSLYAQSMKPDRILLWLAKDEFPQREADLPLSLQEDIAAKKITLRWCDNLGSHKKYFYAMQEYPEDIIVTVDDDTFYHQNTLKMLMEGHIRFPYAVVARTASLVLFDSDLNPLPMNEWLFDFQFFFEPSMLLHAVGVGGVLYPPHSVNEKIFDKDFILETCTANGRTFGDDLLLKVGEMLNNTLVVSVKSEPYHRLPGTQGTALATLMPNQNHKNLLVKKYKEKFQDCFDKDSVQRLKRWVSDFIELDNKFGLRKNYWLTRSSRDLERQLGYLSLPDAPSELNEYDYLRIKETAHIAARVFTAYPADTSDDETTRAIHTFQQQLLNIPDIDNLAKSDAVVCGFVKYGVPLNTKCHTIYHGIPIYMLSLKNWQSFMDAHPNCETVFRKGYKNFLESTETEIGKAKSILSKTEIDEWTKAYKEALKKCTITHKVSSFGFMKRGLKKWARIIFTKFFI